MSPPELLKASQSFPRPPRAPHSLPNISGAPQSCPEHPRAPQSIPEPPRASQGFPGASQRSQPLQNIQTCCTVPNSLSKPDDCHKKYAKMIYCPKKPKKLKSYGLLGGRAKRILKSAWDLGFLGFLGQYTTFGYLLLKFWDSFNKNQLFS